MRFPRPDVVALLVEALDSDSHSVSSGEDEFLDASAGPRSVLQVSSSPHGRYSRWSFKVNVTVTTFADSAVGAYDAHVALVDRLLNLNYLGTANDWYVSSVLCEMEPENITGQSAPSWDGQASTYELFIRHRGGE